ncbi:hypothetical protein B6U91_01640 [Candidatus Pacearchaeota archaeon ex4484_71]|nr:MAG: hypothetical protein B6U91_01640 [Candidatus Pacearchaeota archaeon ex4484_71]
MAEKDDIYSSKAKYDGIFSFKDFYKFCYEWLRDETGLDLQEKKYVEKIKGSSKDIDVEWEGSKKMTEYFRFDAKIKFRILGLSEVEINQDGRKFKTNKGSVEVSVKGTLVRDYDGKFETTASKKFLRSIYEKWVIADRISEYEDKIASACEEFVEQAKAYLDLEGRH